MQDTVDVYKGAPPGKMPMGAVETMELCETLLCNDERKVMADPKPEKRKMPQGATSKPKEAKIKEMAVQESAQMPAAAKASSPPPWQ